MKVKLDTVAALRPKFTNKLTVSLYGLIRIMFLFMLPISINKKAWQIVQHK